MINVISFYFCQFTDLLFNLKDFDSFFVKIDSGGYIEVWGISGIIPNLDKLATKLL